MRIAALAFGVLAGLVASLILALGGLDAAALVGVDPRQHALIRFGLFIIANFGVFGAGLVLASPLAGAILLIVGAFAWIGAAFILHHGPDYVMLTPPGLLLLAAGLAIAAYLRRPQFDDDDEFGLAQAAVTQRAAIAAQQNDEEDEEEPDGAMPVGASFFGEAGTATAMRGVMARQPEPQRRESDDWTPVRKRVEPPRQQPMFRRPDDEYDDDEETGFSRGARITSSILSFGLYGALAAAAVLVFVNFRTGDVTQPTATKIEAPEPISSKAAPPAAAPSSQLQIAQSPTLEASRSASVAQAAPIAPTLVPSPGTVLVPSEPIQPPAAELSQPLVAEASQTPLPSVAPSSSLEPSSEPGPEDLTNGAAPPTGPLMPFAMPAQIAAFRAKTPPSPSAPAAPAKPPVDQGI